jgi:tetratricopeptide (TPR) repeat protein
VMDDYYGLEYYYDFLSEAYFNSGRLKEFLELFETSGDFLNEPEKKAVIYNRIGNQLVNASRQAEAFPYYEKAISLDNARPIYIFNVGYMHSRAGNWSEAISYYLKALDLRRKTKDDPYGLEYYYDFLSEAYFNIGKLEEFIRMFEESGDLKNEAEKKAIIYNRIGNLHSDLQKIKEAIPYYKIAIELDPVRPIYLSNIGLMYALLNDWNKALEFQQKAYDLRLKATADSYDVEYYRSLLDEAKSKSQAI